MKFLIASSRTKSRILSLGAVLASAAILLSLVAATNASKEVPVGETVERGGVAVTLEKLVLKDNETQLFYSYNATSRRHVEPLGLPRISLSNGDKLDSDGGNRAVNGAAGSGSRTAKLPPIPEGTDSVSVDLASFVLYTSGTELVEIPVGDVLEDVDFNRIVERQAFPIDVRFSVGSGEYRFTRLLLDPSGFVLVYEPVNEVGSLTVLGGGLSSVALTDDQDRAYRNVLAGAEWNRVDDEGHTVVDQELYFDGLPGSDTASFYLRFDGTGEIKAPYVFQVDIPR